MGQSSDQKKGMPSDLMGDLAAMVAKQKAMQRGCKFLPHGCRMFMVEQGWESTTILGDKSILVADTLLTFESALCNPDSKIIFVPLKAMMTDGDIEKVCQRNAITKTIFREVEKL